MTPPERALREYGGRVISALVATFRDLDLAEAVAAFDLALALTPAPAEALFLTRRRAELCEPWPPSGPTAPSLASEHADQFYM